MKTKVTPISFINKGGNKLFGILHIPDEARKDFGIIILSPGIKSRVAPHRLYIKMARHLCQSGFQVLRFDPEGIGDSEGEIDERFAADFYGTVQVGRFVEDTICAMDWMEQECDISRFILTGLCGGAITGLLTGAKDQRVEALLGLGIPVILDSSKIDHSKYITEGQLKGLREGYLRKILSPKAWVRFFTFRSEYRVILKIVARILTGKFSFNEKPEKTGQAPKEIGNPDNQGNFNALFVPAFKKMAASRGMLLVFSESDRLYWEFEEKFLRVYGRDVDEWRNNFEVYMVKEANHIFSFGEWQDDMLDKCDSWLRDYFAVAETHPKTAELLR